MTSGEINLDYLLPIFLYIVAGRRTGAIMLAIICGSESVKLFDSVYFFTQQDLYYAVGYIGYMRHSYVLVVSAGIIITLTTITWAWLKLLPPNGDRANWLGFACAGGLMLVLATVDSVRGFTPVFKEELRWGRHFTTEALAKTVATVIKEHRHSEADIAPIEGASTSIFREVDLRAPQPNVVLILVESMGLLNDANARDKELSVIRAPSLEQKYSIQEYAVPFRGATVSGEIRELCGLQSGIKVERPILQRASGCLPKLMEARGYETQSVHGYTGYMFQRFRWHKQLGFQKSTFSEELQGLPNMRFCPGAFRALCDADVATYIDGRLRNAKVSGKPQFIFWITLNSHLPLNEADAPDRPCPGPYTQLACKQLGYISVVLESIAKVASDPAIGPTEFIIVGDHAPPFVTPANRTIVAADQVPAIRLLPFPVQ